MTATRHRIPFFTEILILATFGLTVYCIDSASRGDLNIEPVAGLGLFGGWSTILCVWIRTTARPSSGKPPP